MTSDNSPKRPIIKKVTRVIAQHQANARLVELMRAQQNALDTRARSSSTASTAQQQHSSGNSQGTVSTTTKPRE